MLAKSGRGASGGGSGRLQAALARGGGGAPGRPLGGAPGRHVQQLVDAIIELGHLPTQCKKSSAEEKILAVRLIRARKADLRKAWEVRKSQQRAAVRIVKAEKMMQEVQSFDVGVEKCSLPEEAVVVAVEALDDDHFHHM